MTIHESCSSGFEVFGAWVVMKKDPANGADQSGSKKKPVWRLFWPRSKGCYFPAFFQVILP